MPKTLVCSYCSLATMTNPRSVHSKQPSNSGGTEAAQGYLFQHHVSVSILLDMMQNAEIETVYIETHDDITLVLKDGKVELVQVKTTDKDQLWTIALLTQTSTGRDGKKKANSSMLHTSLGGDDLHEVAIFRIVTSLGAKKELKGLKLPRDSAQRDTKNKDFKTLVDSLEAKLGNFKSGNGNGGEYWAKNTFWECPGDLDAVKNANSTKLRKLLESLGEQLSQDQETKIYDSLLSKVFHAAAADFALRPDQKRFEKATLLSWLTDEARGITFNAPGSGTKLQRKLTKASVPPSDQVSAFNARMAYRNATLSQQYLSLSSWEPMQSEVEIRLAALRVEMDIGKIDEGLPFISKCNKELKEIRRSLPDPILEYLIVGYMYDLTSRCLHRFTKVV